MPMYVVFNRWKNYYTPNCWSDLEKTKQQMLIIVLMLNYGRNKQQMLHIVQLLLYDDLVENLTKKNYFMENNKVKNHNLKS